MHLNAILFFYVALNFKYAGIFCRFVSSNIGGKLKLIQMHKLLCKI